MNKIMLKKTLNLHKYSIKISDYMLNWKFILPIMISVAGLCVGSAFARGEGTAYLKISEFIHSFFSAENFESFHASVVFYLLVPTLFAVALFFSGLSVYGGIVSNIIPGIYSFFVAIITYYFYSNFTLKGLAYCVIIIFPYAVLTLLSLILITGESISMSQQIIKNLNKNARTNEYNFKAYYLNCLKSYIFIVLATGVKSIIDYLFIGIFDF